MDKLQKIISKLEKHHKKKIDLTLGRTHNLLKKLGSPESKLKNVVNIVGTNSKASMAFSLKSILNEAGFNFKDVVRSKIYLTDMNNFSKVNEVYGSYFEKNYEPARTTIEVSGLPLGVDVEIDMIAVN